MGVACLHFCGELSRMVEGFLPAIPYKKPDVVLAEGEGVLEHPCISKFFSTFMLLYHIQ